MHKNQSVFLYLNGKNMVKGITSKKRDVVFFYIYPHPPKNVKWELNG